MTQLPQLPLVPGQHLGVQPVRVGQAVSLHPEIHLHGASPNVPPHHLVQAGLERGKTVTGGTDNL